MSEATDVLLYPPPPCLLVPQTSGSTLMWTVQALPQYLQQHLVSPHLLSLPDPRLSDQTPEVWEAEPPPSSRDLLHGFGSEASADCAPYLQTEEAQQVTHAGKRVPR